jgi:cytoskeletal protein CcmA (bactofilin family)
MPDHASDDSKEKTIGTLPHFAMRAEGARLGALRPPAKPFFKPTTADKALREKAALERPSGDRTFIERMGVMAPTASYRPPPQRRATEIPNYKSVRAAQEAKDETNNLTIGKRLKVVGEISGCARLYVEGSVDAVIIGLKKIDIAPSGKVVGKADVHDAVVSGTFSGTMIVRGHLEIHAGAIVTGEISYKSVSIAAGGVLTGTVKQLD